jgi:uncharacterized protein YndB with AHSA1/START domain
MHRDSPADPTAVTTMSDAIPRPGLLQTHRTLAFPADAVYTAFADPAQLAAWWGPAGFTNTFETFEFRPGGQWRFVMHGPDGTDYPNECRFGELVPGERIVIRHVVEPRFTLTVTLAPDRAAGADDASDSDEIVEVRSRTRLHWEQAFDDPKIAAAVRPICEPANEQNLDRLTAVLAKRRTD